MHQPHHPIHFHTALAYGFTLVELMVSVGVLSILAMLGAPLMQQLMERWQTRQSTGALEETLYLARAEAIKRGGNVTVEKYANSTSCQNASTTEEWGCGWILCHDINNNGTCNANEPKLREVRLSGNVNVMRKPSGKSLKFDRYGMTNGANIISFRFLPASTGTSSDNTAVLCMASGGRIRVIPNELECPKK